MKKVKHKQKQKPQNESSAFVFSVKTEEDDYKEYAKQYFIRPAETYLFFLIFLLILWIVFNIRAGTDYGSRVWFLLGFILVAVMVAKNGAALSYRISGMDKITIRYRFGTDAFSAKAGRDEELHGYDEIKKMILMNHVLVIKMRVGAFVLPYRTMPDKQSLITYLKTVIPEKKWRTFERSPRRGKSKVSAE